MAKLNNSSKTAAEAVASKISKGNTKSATTSQPNNSIQTPFITNDIKGNVNVDVPGLSNLSPENISGALPQFDADKYVIVDPLNPSDYLPQVSKAQFERGKTIYEGTQNSLKLTGLAFDTTREKFNTVGKQAKAIGAGIQAATEIEKVKGNFLDYQTQLEVTQQKGVNLNVAQTKTVTDRNIAVYTKVDLSEKLKLAELKAQESAAKTLEAQGKLNALKQQLGEYLPK